jgi:polysaccharide biosynthesis protein PslH
MKLSLRTKETGWRTRGFACEEAPDKKPVNFKKGNLRSKIKSMKILMIMHFVPYPPQSGALQRNYNLLREIAANHEVYLITLTQKALIPNEAALSNAVANVSPFCKLIKVFDIPSDSHPLRWHFLLFRSIFSKIPYSTRRFSSREMQKEIENILETVAFDLIHVDTIDLAGYVNGITTIPKVLSHHNLESELLFRRAAHSRNPLARWYLCLQAQKLKRYEQRMIPQFKINVTVSPKDLEGIRLMANGGTTILVPNGTDTVFFSPQVAPQTPSLIFAGGLNWLPNVDAMIHFCKAIFPIIAAEVPDVRMKIIGANPPAGLQKISKKNTSIEILGFVPDIRVYMASAAVYVVPLRIGGGTRLKILDALAMGKAVVSTTVGAEGLALQDGVNILIGDTDEAFAQKVVGLLKNPVVRKSIGDAGRLTVERKYSWKVISPILLDVYREVCKK